MTGVGIGGALRGGGDESVAFGTVSGGGGEMTGSCEGCVALVTPLLGRVDVCDCCGGSKELLPAAGTENTHTFTFLLKSIL